MKTAFVTGGSQGIGLAISTLLIENGYQIAVFARDINKLNEIKEKLGSNCSIFECDTTKYVPMSASLDLAIQKLGVPDVLINCVGRAVPNYFEKISPNEFANTLNTNILGIVHPCQYIFPLMKSRKRGIIINTSSVAGFLGVFGYTDYAASKFAIIGFSESLRQEGAKHGVEIKVLCPPDTETPGLEAENKTKPIETKAISEGGGLLKPEKIAEAVMDSLDKKGFYILPGFDSKITFWIKRHFPFLIDWMIKRKLSKF
jgi:3-dehydrosphinganine reductase